MRLAHDARAFGRSLVSVALQDRDIVQRRWIAETKATLQAINRRLGFLLV